MSEQTPQILVVDDDPEIRKLLARYVEGQAFRVLLASSCSELRERLATDRIDLVVCNGGCQFAVKVELRDFPS